MRAQPRYHVFLEQGTQEPSEGFDCLRMVEVTGRKFRLQWADGCFQPFVWEFRA